MVGPRIQFRKIVVGQIQSYKQLARSRNFVNYFLSLRAIPETTSLKSSPRLSALALVRIQYLSQVGRKRFLHTQYVKARGKCAKSHLIQTLRGLGIGGSRVCRLGKGSVVEYCAFEI